MNTKALGIVAGVLAMGTGCDFSGDFLFPGAVEGVPGVQHLGTIEPAVIGTTEDLEAATIYGEVGPTGTPERGGVTFDVVGTGNHVCIWVDPELAYWNQSVSRQAPVERYSYPDNVFDDGDLDLSAGFSVYYTGTQGEKIGDFKVQYEDSLGNEVEVDLTECSITSDFTDTQGGHSGRGAPEHCTLFNTIDGVSYTIVMETWSTPLDDDRLGYGLIVADGTCKDLADVEGAAEECVIMGEAVTPFRGDETQGTAAAAAGLPELTWLGRDEVPNWGGSEALEINFCQDELRKTCRNEGTEVFDAGHTCSWGAPPQPDVDGEPNTQHRCYCGNLEDTPSGGAF